LIYYFGGALLPHPYLARMLVPLLQQVRQNSAVVSVLKRVLQRQGVAVPPLQARANEDAEVVATRLLIRNAILVEDDMNNSNTVCFASHLHYRHFCRELYPSQVPRSIVCIHRRLHLGCADDIRAFRVPKAWQLGHELRQGGTFAASLPGTAAACPSNV